MTSVSGEKEPLALTRFQIEVAQLFFSLPAARGFLLAGGAALVAQHLTSRPTQDLDLRLIVHGNEDLLVDLALDSPPEHPATASLVGPTFAPQELAGRNRSRRA